MALDKIVDSSKLNAALTATANAIRAKTGDSDTIAFDMTTSTGFAAAVADISGGGALQELVAGAEGEYLPGEGYDGFSKVTVTVPGSGRSPRERGTALYDFGAIITDDEDWGGLSWSTSVTIVES